MNERMNQQIQYMKSGNFVSLTNIIIIIISSKYGVCC